MNTKNGWSRCHKYKLALPSLSLKRPCQGGPMSSVWILTCFVWVFINACRLLSALQSLSQFGGGRLSLVTISFYALSLLFGPCHLSEFMLAGLLSRLTNISAKKRKDNENWMNDHLREKVLVSLNSLNQIRKEIRVWKVWNALLCICKEFQYFGHWLKSIWALKAQIVHQAAL